jgi:hypothetical protein
MTKVCPRCGYPNPDNVDYCIRCGYQLTPVIPNYNKKGSKVPAITGILVIVVIVVGVFGYFFLPYKGVPVINLHRGPVINNLIPPTTTSTTTSYTLIITNYPLSPNEKHILLGLATVLGKSYKIVVYNGFSSEGQLIFGTLFNEPLINFSYVYFIENESYIQLFSPYSSYWSNVSYHNWVLQIVPAKPFSAAALMLNTTGLNYTGGNYTVVMVGTFTEGNSSLGIYGLPDYPADGYTVMMFVTPVHNWVNGSTYYTSELRNVGMKSPAPGNSGEILYPYSSTPYIVVQWEPYWYASRYYWNTGEFNVWVVYPSPNGTVTENNIKLLIGGGGNGFIQGLQNGDLIMMTVTYDGHDNTIYAKVVDLNTSNVITLDLPLYTNFTTPHSGGYWTEINAGTGGSYWNWGLLYLSVLNNLYVTTVNQS